MATDVYIGPNGGDWSDPKNWSLGIVPSAGDVADVFSQNAPEIAPDTVSGLTIDLSTTYAVLGGGYHAIAQPNLTAGALGTASAPVLIEATADSGATCNAFIEASMIDGSILVDPGQTLGIEGSTAISGTVTIEPGGTLDTIFLASLAAINTVWQMDGRVLVDGGAFVQEQATDVGGGAIEIANGGEFSLSSPTAQTEQLPIIFAASGGTVAYSPDTIQISGAITGFGAHDDIDLTFSGSGFVASYDNNTLTIDDGWTTQLHFVGDYTLADFAIGLNGNEIDITYNPCFVGRTSIETVSGDRPVEDLRAGDVVVLATGGTAVVRWIGHRRATDACVVRFRPDALAPSQPRCDLYVSEDHALYLDGVLVQAALLVNSETIVREHRNEVTFWHVELERHGILLAEGAAAESYLDSGNRRQFSNCPISYDPIDAARHEPCTEMVFAGDRLATIRRSLEASARPARNFLSSPAARSICPRR